MKKYVFDETEFRDTIERAFVYGICSMPSLTDDQNEYASRFVVHNEFKWPQGFRIDNEIFARISAGLDPVWAPFEHYRREHEEELVSRRGWWAFGAIVGASIMWAFMQFIA